MLVSDHVDIASVDEASGFRLIVAGYLCEKQGCRLCLCML